MSKSLLARSVALAALGTSITLPSIAQAAFFEDSKASIELRNFYMNRDFRQDGAAQSKAEEWAQGFLLRYESGYTDGTVGFGVDAIGLLGLKLDSSFDREGTGLLPNNRSRGEAAPDDYSEFGATGKMRISKTTAKIGTLMPKLPAIAANDSRLLPQTFQGGWLSSQEIAGLTFDAGQINRVSHRDASYNRTLVLNGGTATAGSRGFTSANGDSDEFNFAGLSYKWNDQLTTTYNYGGLEDLYKQHILNLVHVLPIADKQSFKTDLRFARSTDDGDTNVDNKAFGAMFTYGLGGHSFGLGYQQMDGDTGYAYIGGTDPFLVNYVQIGDFANKDEKSWQARYDFNFASIGIPGLTFMTRYLSGDNIDLGVVGADDGKEWERNTDIAYVIQSGPLKNLGLKWRNATTRANFGNDLDENRLILSYTLSLW